MSTTSSTPRTPSTLEVCSNLGRNSRDNIQCPPAPFCDHLIDCTFCSAVVFNPECWPVGAILSIALLAYFFITGCYVFLYIPLTLGIPVRVLTSFLWHSLRQQFRVIFQRIMRRNRRNWNRTMDLAELLAVIFAAVLLLKYTESCQQVDIFSHSSTLCEASDRGTICNVRLSEVLKLSAFKKEACLKLLRGNASIHEIRVEWKTLSLLCEPVTMLFTRHTSYHVDSSKRCPHTGSCTGQKCTGINTSAIISELERETIILASLCA